METYSEEQKKVNYLKDVLEVAQRVSQSATQTSAYADCLRKEQTIMAAYMSAQEAWIDKEAAKLGAEPSANEKLRLENEELKRVMRQWEQTVRMLRPEIRKLGQVDPALLRFFESFGPNP